MSYAHGFRFIAGSVLASLLIVPLSARAQADAQKTVREFLQAWYVDRKSPEDLKSYVARDNGFNVGRSQAKGPVALAQQEPVNELFTGAFTKGTIRSESALPQTLGEMIEYAPAKKLQAIAGANPKPKQASKQYQPNCAMASEEFAVCKPEELPRGTVLPGSKPLSSDALAMYLWHLSQDYKGKLYVVLYSTKGAGLLRETAIQYWIQEDGAWKLAAFKGTNW